MKTIVPLLCLLLVSGCATDPMDILPGTPAADVQARVGAPAERISLPNGGSEWFYPYGHYRRATYAVVLGPDEKVTGVEQRLTEANVKKIVADKTTIKEVRALIGPPLFEVYYPISNLQSWEYKLYNVPWTDWKILAVQFSDEGVVRKIVYMDDPEYYRSDNDRCNRPC